MYVFNLPKTGTKNDEWRQVLHGKALTADGLSRLNYYGTITIRSGDVQGNAGLGLIVTRDMVVYRR